MTANPAEICGAVKVQATFSDIFLFAVIASPMLTIPSSRSNPLHCLAQSLAVAGHGVKTTACSLKSHKSDP